MYAIVKIQGQQFRVEKNDKIFVHRLNEKEGKNFNVKDVLLIDNDGKIKVGEPNVKGASVKAKVLKHLKGDKVLVFKKKRRKGYKKLNGHRQYLSQILIEDIKTTTKKTTKKKEEPKKEDVKKEQSKNKENLKKEVKKTSENKKEEVKKEKPENKEKPKKEE